MNNCLCNVFYNTNWIWIILIVLLFSCCCGGCRSLPRSLLPPDRGEPFFCNGQTPFFISSPKKCARRLRFSEKCGIIDMILEK